jgi:hypothetical protein
MAPDADDPASANAHEGAGSWMSDYTARLVQTVEDSVRASTSAANRWASRSLEDHQWSIDTVTADAIADWEELTPLAGRWLDLWLEAAQQAMKGAREGGR